ncbi:two-component system response regulator YesN [Symbiobacterium terraclitae]|uniref:Stage 0 sporulation protein A homolog n=1 Tax=Symbiobacterium terraclitae TaxID=557451 RepID=A0ABS4JXE2_9FIRM|nr:response regulator [Symbiobacterium terraclitae]MBP2019650.1 two-component system response regulator YesN [Symbiobacterium terraclitae]
MRILVADDEPIEREALRVLVQRHLPEAEVVGEAGTGTQAVDLAERLHPDVILLDIQMPGLTGLEALHEIRNRCPDTRCVIVSAYDYFHFACEALRLGAADYLLKPVKRDQMVDLLRRLAREIASERQRRQDDLAHKEQLSLVRPLAEAELFRLLISGDCPDRRATLQQFLGVELQAGLCMVLGLTARSLPPDMPEAERTDLKNRAFQYLRSLAHSLCTCVVGPEEDGVTPLLIAVDLPIDEYHARTWSSALARRLRDRVKEQTGVRLRAGIGTPATPGAFLRSYQEAQAAFRFEDVSEKVTHFGDLEEGLLPEGGDPRLAPPHLPDRWRPTPAVLTAVETGKRFIEEHFAEDLSLERVAREVSLTPYYFSKIFSRVCGESVVDYLTRVRIETAKRLLADPAVTIKETCFAVGYNDPNYFSRVFKKVTGQTPTEYRTSLV